MAITGKLWYGTETDNPTGGNDTRFVRVNGDGTAQVTVFDDNPDRSNVDRAIGSIGIDTAANFFFAITSPDFMAGVGARLIRGNLDGSNITVVADFRNGTPDDTSDDQTARALYVDTIGHRIFVGVGVELRHYSYDPLSGDLTYIGLVPNTQLVPVNVYAFGYDRDSDDLYFSTVFTDSYRGLFRRTIGSDGHNVDVTAGNVPGTFPDSGYRGYAVGIAVDSVRDLVYYTTTGGSVQSDDALYRVPTQASRASPVLVPLINAPANFKAGQMTIDEQAHVLYIESKGLPNDNSDDIIAMFALSADGATATYVRTITPSTFQPASGGDIDIDELFFTYLPTTTATVNGGGYTEGAAAVNVFTGAVAINDFDGGYLRGATVQITDNLTTGDVLSATAGSGVTVSGYNSATGMLTLSGYATLASYQSVLATVKFASPGNDPTAKGDRPTRTITVTLNDGTPGVTAGSGNSSTYSLTVNGINDAPLFAATGAQPSYVEKGAAVAIASGVTLSDVDNANFAGGTISLAATGLVAGDQIAIRTSSVAGSGIEVTGASVSFNGVAFATLTSQTASGLSAQLGAASTPAAVIALTQAIVFSTTSANPTSASRSVTFTLVDGGGATRNGTDTAGFTRTVSVTPVDDPVAAVAKTATTFETTVVTGNVLTGNADPDGGPASTVGAVNGVAGNVNTSVALASGARVTVASNGSYTYDPNGAFSYLLAPGGSTGGQSSATDTFTYTVTGGGTATVTVTIAGVTSAGDQIRGVAGTDTLTGTPAADYIDLSQGGTDTIDARNGDDLIFAGAGFDATDTIVGGLGYDQVGLRGSYAGNLGKVTGTEFLAVLSGASVRYGGDGSARYTYNLTTSDATVASGVVYTVQANELVAGETLRFDGSLESDGSFRIYAGKGIDTVIGGQNGDGFLFGEGGRFTASDQINGGGGDDQLALRGNYGAAITFNATTLVNVETIVLLSAAGVPAGFADPGSYVYNLITHNATVAATQTLTINAAQLGALERALINGAAETDGSFTFVGGQGNDVFIGGSGADTFYGGAGADTLTGGLGVNIFRYGAASDSLNAARDTVTDFKTNDRIDLSLIDAIAGGADDAFRFVTGAFVNTGIGQVRSTLASGSTYLVEGDIDGDGTIDFAINVTSNHAIVAADFIF